MVLGHLLSSGGLRHSCGAPWDLPQAGVVRGRMGTLVNSLVGKRGHLGSSEEGEGRPSSRQKGVHPRWKQQLKQLLS